MLWEIVVGVCHGTPPWHLTHVHLFSPTQQSETDHEIAAIYGNLRQSAMFCWILPSLLNSAKFCQDYDLKPILPYTRVNWATKSIIYTPSSRFFISFPYVMSWFHYTVYVCSLIISTLLYIIATCTHSVTNIWDICNSYPKYLLT